jgi:hypothetical protein
MVKNELESRLPADYSVATPIDSTVSDALQGELFTENFTRQSASNYLPVDGPSLAKSIDNRERRLTIAEWRKSPLNALSNPRLTQEQARKIIDEAIAHGCVWDVQEKINARRRAELQRYDLL